MPPSFSNSLKSSFSKLFSSSASESKSPESKQPLFDGQPLNINGKPFFQGEMLFDRKAQSAKTAKSPIRKRHWALGSMLILGGSWITHTTTATINESSSENNASFSSPVFQYDTDDSLSESVLPKPTIMSAPTMLTFAANTSTIRAYNAAMSFVEPEPEYVTRSRVIKRGESLGIIFRKEGLGHKLPHKISEHPIASQLTSISVGKEFEFKFDDSQSLRQINYPVSSLKQLVVDIDNDEIVGAQVRELDYVTKEHNVSAEIRSSLYEAALKAGLSNNTVLEMVRIFGWDIDFVQDIRAGDTFHVIYTDHIVDGKKVSDGEILAAEFTTQGQRYRAIRFEDENGNVSYYTPEGESMLGTFLRSPVEFSRISSRFGKRRHPISKKWKTHKGVDYAASRGTPIRATADGKVVHAGRKGGYGKTIVLRHAGRFTTLYAHMNGFAKGIKSGARVKQGDTIGYVGSTGYSTGPHLHYEFRVDGIHRDSLTYKTPKASSIKPELRPAFDAVVAKHTRELDAVSENYLLAKASADSEKI